MQINPELYVSVDISTSVYSCGRRSLDIQLCILASPDLASNASRVVLSVSLERDFRHAPPPKHVTSSSVLQIVPSP